MQINIAVITTEFLRDFINASFRELNPGFGYSIYSYASFEELSDIYQSIPADINGVITSGAFPSWIIRHSFPESRRFIHTIDNDDSDICRLALQLMNARPGLRLDRVYADPVEVFGVSLERYAEEERRVSFSQRMDDYLRGKSLSYLIEREAYYRGRHLALWEQGAIDVSITRFSSIMSVLRDSGLPVQFAYPSLAYVAQVCQETFQAVSLQHFQDNQIAAVVISPARSAETAEAERRLARLQKVLARFSALSPYEILPRQTTFGYEFLTNRKAVDALTDGFCACRLQEELRPRLDFDFNVGYGLGENIYHARLNAVDANREAANLPAGSSCLVNERDAMVAPLRRRAQLVVSREPSPPGRESSSRAGLSWFTLRKIAAAMAAFGGSEITARELAELLSLTPRSANRFLSALHEAGLARLMDERRGTTRGRPERVYAIAMDKLG